MDTKVDHDRPEQLQMILAGLMDGEQAIVVFDCIGVGTGFFAVTTQRVVFQDKSFVGGKMAITSVPFRNIRSVSMVSDKSILKWASTSTVALDIGGKALSATFRGDDKAKYVHDLVLWYLTR